MSSWTAHDLDTFGGAREVDIAPRRPDGTAPRSTTIWIVRIGDGLYVRSYRGAAGSWYRAARKTGRGRIFAGGVERDVTFETVDDIDSATVGDAYRAKYGQSSYVDAMVTAEVAATTLRLAPT